MRPWRSQPLGWWLARAPAAIPVHTQAARALGGGSGSANASVLDATGYVTARREATVSAQITGTLTQVLIEEGDHVKAGQVLGRLDDTAQRAAVAQAQAQVNSAQALLVQSQASLAQYERDVKRADDLVTRHLVSEQAMEQARTQVDTQTAQVLSQRKLIDLAQANLRSAQVQLDYCTVRAPFAGVVIAKAAQVGEIVSPFSAGGGFTRTGIGTIVDMDSLEIEVDVNEAYINRVQPDQPVESVLNAYPDWKIPSHVIAIIPTADRSKATVKVRIGLDLRTRASSRTWACASRSSRRRRPQEAPQAAPARRAGARRPRCATEGDQARRLRHEGRQGAAAHGDARRRPTAMSRQVLTGVDAGESVIVDPPAELKDEARSRGQVVKRHGDPRAILAVTV